ncbi:acyltransferase family protein [Burkholderia sp. BDU5]|uniref:acyltransferase family protein n=1 Tax=Burkholderia sp. BDU5 TaxID=1385590 RepID=UPI000753D7D5|nr:acyltransferase [Burkholderia sp. BDU5]KVE43038.1 acyltransferase [Burkholderia sp. BDU5]
MEPRKLGFIDSLRGFAALYVLVFHFSAITTPHAVAPQWLAHFADLGGSGVTLFFLLSAFTLCLSSESRKDEEGSPLLNFYIRRFFRIAPLFYAWIVIYCIRDKIIFGVVHSPAEVASSLFFVFNLSPGNEQGFVWASWTLGVEMIFYVFFPFIFKLASNLGRAFALLLFSFLLRWVWHFSVPHLIDDQAIAAAYYSLSVLRHLPTFIFGIVAYRIYVVIDMSRARQIGAGEAMFAAGAFALLAVAYGVFSVDSFEGLTIESYIYSAMLIGLAITSPRWFVNPITRFYGKISYSVYLSHATTLFVMSRIFVFVYEHFTSIAIPYIFSLGIGIAVVTVISSLTYWFIEIPGNKLGRRLIDAIQKPIAI